MAICRSDKEANECKYVELCRNGCQYQIVNGIRGQTRNKEEQLFIFVCRKDAQKFKTSKRLHGKHRIVPIHIDYVDGKD